ncbi:sirohydrochlorin chelatase [Pullulanibacillus sp. KACC 23026]|uniref:sirohydrochlorin chelatase n=1 Tax=Pullulanibacillus sp. KACC 23026 TaxID=3028315 RepID=UPI0023B19CE0|nr:sirohydrochlorin chelatase [Pullulanibacillus sp. KACC 23026]WEG12992.1 sirohydrochlorin chelatase [Pullulanibacillus sp. KACC 23026]
MQAVLYISHGTRVKRGVDQAVTFIQSCIEHVPVQIQEICFLELVNPSIKKGIERCIKRGATDILIQPVLLLAAGHVKQDIPREIAAISKDYPEIRFHFGDPFGCDSKIIDILSDRIYEKGTPVLGNSAVLLVGRGSSDPDIQEAFKDISQRLWEKEAMPVSTCFLAACEPLLGTGLKNAKTSPFKQIFVIPYLMFTGLLMREMEEAIEALQSPDQTFYLCRPLGSHKNLRTVLVDRVMEGLNLEEVEEVG